MKRYTNIPNNYIFFPCIYYYFTGHDAPETDRVWYSKGKGDLCELRYQFHIDKGEDIYNTLSKGENLKGYKTERACYDNLIRMHQHDLDVIESNMKDGYFPGIEVMKTDCKVLRVDVNSIDFEIVEVSGRHFELRNPLYKAR